MQTACSEFATLQLLKQLNTEFNEIDMQRMKKC